MTKWIQDRIQIDDLNKQFKSRYSSSTAKTNRLGLVLGSADVLRGKIKTFREDDLSLAAVLACGSLDEMGGVTTIVSPPHDGTYLDGAWADNPPLNELLDYGLDEIWLIQCFPKAISEVPRTPAERRERKDELWQNSLVEHELEFVRFVDHWHKAINDAIMAEIDNLKKSGKLPADAEQLVEFLQRLHARDGKLPKYLDRLFDELNNFAPKKYKQVNVKRIEIMIPRELGSAIVNAPWFIRNLMRLGYEQALRFADNGFDDKPMPQLRPAGWATIASPANDLLYGVKPPSPPTPKPFMKGPIGDALELACDFCPRKAVSTAGELFLDVLPKTVQGALKKMDTTICDFCPKTQMARLAA